MLELTVVPTSLSLIKQIDFCDAFIVGEKEYSLRLPYYFSYEEIIEIIDIVKKREQKIYIALNNIMHEDNINDVKEYLRKLSLLNIDGIIFGDLAVYQLAQEFHLVEKLIYNPETYVTNYETVGFFARKGIKRVSIAKEITLEDIKLIASKQLLEVEVLGHGAVNMFHSMRDLVSNYFRFLKHEEPESYRNKDLYLVEEIRKEQYPIYEDRNGTHVFSGHDLCTIEYLDELISSHVTSIRLDGLFKDDFVLYEIVKVYKEALNDYDISETTYIQNKAKYIERLKDIQHIRPFNEGFLFKKTVYKGGENENNR